MAILDATGEIVIHDGNYQQFLAAAQPGQGFGLVPRNFSTHPCGAIPGIPKASIPKIPRSEWPERVKELEAHNARLSDVRNIGNLGQRIPSRDQNGRGYCWAHSPVSCALLMRAKMGLPFADLSAYAIACIIKNYRDEGGWNAESVKFLAKRGCPTSATWPQQGTSRSYDNPKTWEEAAFNKLTHWEDIPEGDFDQQFTYALLGYAAALDLNWWSHSVAAADPVDGASTFGRMRGEAGKLLTVVEWEAVWRVNDFGGAYGLRIWNSWGESWSAAGMGVLTESKARNNGSIALISMAA